MRNAFGGAYASYNNYATGADFVVALPTTRVAVMGPAGVEYVYKDELKKIRASRSAMLQSEAQARVASGMSEQEAEKEAMVVVDAVIKAEEAALAQRYEQEIMNPEEALSLGSFLRSSCLRICGALWRGKWHFASVTTRQGRCKRFSVNSINQRVSRSQHVGTQHYLNNPLIHADRRGKLRQSEWSEQFRCDHLKPLIICRGPIRKEAMDVFSEMGIDGYGILLSRRTRLSIAALWLRS